MRQLGIIAVLVLLAACGRAEQPPLGPAGKTATISVSVPEDGAPRPGIIHIQATKVGLSDLDLEVPVAENTRQGAVLTFMRSLMPAEWQENSYEVGNTIVIEKIETIEVDAGEAGIDLHVTVTPGPPPTYER
jgi:hypothetical protein